MCYNQYMENDIIHPEEFYLRLKNDLQQYSFTKGCFIYLVRGVFSNYVIEDDFDEEMVPEESETGTDMNFHIFTNLLNVFKIYAKDILYIDKRNAVLFAITLKYGLNEVAKKLNIAPSVLTLYCRGIKWLEPEIIKKASKLYNIPTAEFK